MTNLNLQQWIQHPEMLNKDSLYELRMQLVRYPYCQTLHLLYLKNLFLFHDASFGSELKKSALHITDRATLFYLLEGDKSYPLEIAKDDDGIDEVAIADYSDDRTLFLINSFLSNHSDEIGRAHV